MKRLEAEAAEALDAVLSDVSSIRDVDVAVTGIGVEYEVDLIARFTVNGRPQTLVGEVKSNGQPRHVRAGLLQLRDHIQRFAAGATPLFVAPYLSEEAKGLCRDYGVGFLDLEGNCRIVLDGVFIDRAVPTKPAVARRELKSLFKPKSAQVLRVLLRAPERAWKVVELAEAANVSLGHVSNVRTALVDREWASVGAEGLRLTAPDALLDAWRDGYEPPPGTRRGYYTPLHGKPLEAALRDGLDATGPAKAVLASFSAAAWIAPFARAPSQYLYANDKGLDRLRSLVQLSSVAKGENIVITCVDDDSFFSDAAEPAPGIFTTSPVQTYLDLSAAGERGREAADHMRQEHLMWLL